MGKRRPYAPRGQMAFDFATPPTPIEDGGLAGLSRWMSSTSGAMLSEDTRDEVMRHITDSMLIIANRLRAEQRHPVEAAAAPEGAGADATSVARADATTVGGADATSVAGADATSVAGVDVTTVAGGE